MYVNIPHIFSNDSRFFLYWHSQMSWVSNPSCPNFSLFLHQPQLSTKVYVLLRPRSRKKILNMNRGPGWMVAPFFRELPWALPLNKMPLTQVFLLETCISSCIYNISKWRGTDKKTSPKRADRAMPRCPSWLQPMPRCQECVQASGQASQPAQRPNPVCIFQC